LRYNGEAVRTVSAHARRLPLVLLTPDSQQLVLGGPALRRDWLDWAMFHVEQSYLEHWRNYHRALRQRNRLLRDTAPPDELRGWEEAMGRSGLALHQARGGFLRRLDCSFQKAAHGIWPLTPTLELKAGWDETAPLEEQLARSRDDDLARGFTRAGPHRADVLFRCGDTALGATFSRGESKLFIGLLMMAEAAVLTETLAEPPALLLDDFGAELDSRAQARLLELLAGSGAQAFLTTTTASLPRALPPGSRRFHVEHGKFTEMIE
jgi:DNA replication and repair protein RecF